MTRVGFRARVAVIVAGLVAFTAASLSAGAWLLVRRSLRADLVERVTEQVEFNVGVLAADPARLGADPAVADLESGPLVREFRLRGTDGVQVLAADGTYASGFAFALPPSRELADVVATGRVGYEWIEIGATPYLMVGARRPPSGPDFYFFFDATTVASAERRLAEALVAGTALLSFVGAGSGRRVARRVLRPVAASAEAAGRMAGGDLSVRLPVEGDDELAEWAASFNRMASSLEEQLTRLAEAEERQRRFVADAAHELRTPLAAVVAEAAVLADHLDSLPAPAVRAGELLIADVDRLRRLTEELLEVSRLDAGLPPEPRPTDLGAFLRAVVAQRNPAATLATTRAGIVLVDRSGLERIVGNLVENSARHAPGADTVVSAEVTGGTLTVAVADHGPGVAPEVLPRIFDRFVKADASRRRGGTGLGLAIARDHARRLGGDLEASPTPGGGLTVTARLPVTVLLPDGDAAATPTAEGEGASPRKEQP